VHGSDSPENGKREIGEIFLFFLSHSLYIDCFVWFQFHIMSLDWLK